MIKVILNPGSGEKVYTFDKAAVNIGADPAQADIVISGDSIQNIHLQIIEEKDRFVAINSSNDPFCSINGLPFGKKNLKPGDHLEIGAIILAIDLKKTPPLPKTIPVKGDVDTEIEDRVINRTSDKESHDDQSTDGHGDIDAHHDEEQLHPQRANQPKKLEKLFYETANCKTDHPEERQPSNPFQHFIGNHWKMFAGMIFAAVMVCFLLGGLIYFRASGKSSQEEKKIAAGVADIAMAMTYANRLHITPNKQNWADPDFINGNLSRVLAPTLHSQAQINNQSQFTKFPYILRIYTNEDVTRFLIIAQPAPNLLQWLINKTTIVVDSASMEIRKVSDIKTLNKLLANPNALDGKNGLEISRLIQEGNIMTLHCLSGNRNVWGFTPPRALSLIKPGSENHIFNAPRYYPFGETLLTRAIELSQTAGNSTDISLLEEEIKSLEHFHDIVLYSAHGLQPALEAQRALSTFFPTNKFIVAYLKFTSNGYLASSHLLMDDDHGQNVALEPKSLLIKDFERTSSSLMPQDSEGDIALRFAGEGDLSFAQDTEEVDHHHPLFLQLQALNLERQRMLKSQSDEMAFILSQHTQAIVPDFNQKFLLMLASYETIDKEQQEKLIQDITRFYEEYSELPMEEFQGYLRAAGLGPFATDALAHHVAERGGTVLSEFDMENFFDKIVKSQNLADLGRNVHSASALLNIDHLPNTKKLILYQDRIRSLTFNKLCQFFLSPQDDSVPYTDDDFTLLSQILKSAWIHNPEEHEYIVSEFKQMIH